MHPDRPEDSKTRWSRLEAGDFDYLVRKFWKPLHRFLARRLPSAEEADDVTQELFVSFVERDLLSRAGSIEGPLRRYLFQCARNLLVDRARAAGAAKRGAGRVLPIDGKESNIQDSEVEAAASFDREWFRSLFNRARRRLKEYCEKEGKDLTYRAFRLYYFGDKTPERWTQKRIADELGIPITQVNNYVHRARAHFAREMRAAIADYTSNEEEIALELAEMARHFGGMSDLSAALTDSTRSEKKD